MAVEIERKFLVAADAVTVALRLAHASEAIDQGYLAADSEGEVRIRRRGERTVLTAKRGSGLVRDEADLVIDSQAFERLWALTAGRRVSKRRHLVDHGDLTIELDVFSGELDGLCVAEVEFSSREAAAAFEPPEWFGRELTGDDRYSNASLSADGLPEE